MSERRFHPEVERRTAEQKLVDEKFDIDQAIVERAIEVVGAKRGLNRTIGVEKFPNKFFSVVEEGEVVRVNAIREVQTDLQDEIFWGGMKSESEYPIDEEDKNFLDKVFRN